MPTDQRLYAAGYSKDQVVRLARIAGLGGAEEPIGDSGRSDSEIAADTRGQDPSTVARYGLNDQDRTQLGLPASPGQAAPAMAGPPESPPPLPEMTKVGRGRSLFHPEPGGGGSTPLRAREEREARTAAASKAEEMAKTNERSIEELLRPYGGDVNAAPSNIQQVVAILRALPAGR
jgi:hypothetical protein